MARTITYSRNVTLSLSRSCQCHCKYCAFATTKAHLRTPNEVRAVITDAAQRGIKELLVLTGEEPQVRRGVTEQLVAWGHDSFLDYVIWACEQGLAAGMLPHTNLGVLTAGELSRLREVTASQGLMLESISERLIETVHAGSPTKHPARRLETIRAAGELQIPFTSGILVGIGETPDERLASIDALAEVHSEYGHLQEIILQNFVPHRRYYGEDTGAVATEAAERYWRTGLGEAPQHALPDWACEITLDDLTELIAYTRAQLPEIAIQVPPNLSEFWPTLVEAGATDLGGLSANGDHISPEHPFPSPAQVRAELEPRGYALAERLCAHRPFLTPHWQASRVWEAAQRHFPSFIPWEQRASASSAAPALTGDGLHRVLDRAAAGEPPTHEELTLLLADRRPEVTEAVRQAADALRATLCGDEVSFVINRNLNLTNVCTVGCAFCGFGQARRSPDAYELDADAVRERIQEAVADGATELCIQSGIHPDWELDDYAGWLEVCRGTAPQLHLHAFSPMELHAMAERTGLTVDAILTRLRAAGLGSVPGTAAEILDDAVREQISPNKLTAARWVEIISAAHAAGLPTTATVMFGHIEQPTHLATHLVTIRELAARSARARTAALERGVAPADAPGWITEFVPLRFIPHHTRLGRTRGLRELDGDETLRLTALFRLGLGAAVPHLQTSWVKLGLELATESLRWGVDDLGGTLMEESISRMAGADHGTRVAPEELIDAAHRAGRPAAQRTTRYETVARHPLPDAAPAAALTSGP